VITTKVGVARTGPGEWRLNARPKILCDQVEQALRRLRVERIEVLQLHWIDPKTPLADQFGTLRGPAGSRTSKRTSPRRILC
jgi:pyridoxine 4-dehydrogenase